MSLKYKIKSLEGIDESVKSLYTEKDGEYVLSIEGLPQQEDVSGLKKKVDELLSEKKAQQKAAEEAEKARLEAEQAAAAKSGDIKKYEESWQKKYNATVAELDAKNKAILDQLKSKTVHAELGREIEKIAVDSGCADYLKSKLMKSYQFDYDTEAGKIKIFDSENSPVLDDIETIVKRNLVDKSENSRFIKATKGNGGGAGGSNSDGRADSGAKTMPRESFLALPQQDRKAFIKDGGKIQGE